MTSYARGSRRARLHRSQFVLDDSRHSSGEQVQHPLLTVGDVADLLRTSPKAVYELINRGRVPGVVRLGRKILVRRDQLKRALAKGGLP